MILIKIKNGIARYLKIYCSLIKLSFGEILIFRINGLLLGLAPIVWMLTILVFLGIIFSKVKQLGGWSLWEVVFLTGTSEVMFIIYWSSFIGNLRIFINDVRTGRFDQSLLKPLNSRFLASFKTLDFTLIGSFVSSLLVFIYSLVKVAERVDPSRIVGFIFLLILGYLICYFLHLIFASLAFFVTNARSFLDWIFEISDFGHYPAEIYPLGLRAFLTFFVPILFFGYVPTAFLLGKLNWLYLFFAALIALALYLISRCIWEQALKHYQSASS
ncbi:MAG: ABC-2 family transporter protein [bacterium]|nr:ABC-2 family transporter protein [bacterium]